RIRFKIGAWYRATEKKISHYRRAGGLVLNPVWLGPIRSDRPVIIEVISGAGSHDPIKGHLCLVSQHRIRRELFQRINWSQRELRVNERVMFQEAVKWNVHDGVGHISHAGWVAGAIISLVLSAAGKSIGSPNAPGQIMRDRKHHPLIGRCAAAVIGAIGGELRFEQVGDGRSKDRTERVPPQKNNPWPATLKNRRPCLRNRHHSGRRPYNWNR